jgi:hypothetical protein
MPSIKLLKVRSSPENHGTILARFLLPTDHVVKYPQFYWIVAQKWRGRVEVESTTRSAKERVAGFEGREGHRTPFAPMEV